MDKMISLSELTSHIKPGMMIGLGGNGLSRKPMAAAKAIAGSLVTDLDLAVMLGGPETDLLIGMQKVRSLHFAYVGFDRFGMAPNFRKARQESKIRAVEYSEGTFISALSAAAQRVPFMPTRRGLGTDLLTFDNSPFKVFTCPISGERLVAVPALMPDIAIIHVNVADKAGNGLIFGDPLIDPILARAAKAVYLTAERVIDAVPRGQPQSRATLISRLWVNGVCEVPRGGAFTGVFPDYSADGVAVLDYLAHARDQHWLSAFAKSEERL
jgi:glutaconate CoA-transferase subunit A